MPVRSAIVFVLSWVFLPGCSLPRGPIDFDPFVPRWLSHGEISGECAPPAPPIHGGGAAFDPSAVQPPFPKFHPVPTRPVFEPRPVASAAAF
jgi:hypothetical protein